MVRRINPAIVTRPASLVLVAEISHTLRAQGNICATGLDIEASGDPDNPIVSGIYKDIPQNQIGIMDYASFTENVGSFNLNSAYPDRHPWNLISAVSLDAIFCPYNSLADSGRVGPYMPHWTDPESIFSKANSLTLNPFNPFNQITYSGVSGSSIPINKDPWMSGGHNIAMALSYNPYDSGISGVDGYVGISGVYPSGSGAPISLYFEKDHWARHTVETSGIRAVGFKGPLVLTGWGYDIHGAPVPASTGNPNHFHSEASWNTHLWKSGPVDLRWDDQRGVWTGNPKKIYLAKITNLFTPPSFSFEVDRSNSRDQYTRNAPVSLETANTGLIHDPEYLAYSGNPANTGYYEQLNYSSLHYPYYEAFIIRETDDSPACANNTYNIWSEDCQDCGHITNKCGDGHGSEFKSKRILIENPLRQSFDVGDLAFTVSTGRKQRVNSGTFTGGDGTGAAGRLVTDASGNARFEVLSSGSGYLLGGFAIANPVSGCKICTNTSLVFTDGVLTSGTLQSSKGFPPNETCALTIYPNNASIKDIFLPIHWVIQSEFKSQQVVTYAGCDNGILQTCTVKIQTQGYKTCEWCGEDTALINN